MGSCPSPGPAPKRTPARTCQSTPPRKDFLARISALQGDLTAPATLLLSVEYRSISGLKEVISCVLPGRESQVTLLGGRVKDRKHQRVQATLEGCAQA